MLAGLATLLSCNDNFDVEESKETVRFTAELDNAPSTRAIKEADVDRLTVGVLKGGKEVDRFEYDMTAGVADVEFALAKENEYNIIFWAWNSSCNIYDITDMTAVRMLEDTGEVTFAEVEKRDAFCTAIKGFVAGRSTGGGRVVLERPLAQLNIGTAGGVAKAIFTAKEVPDTYHPLTKSVSGSCDYVWAFNEPSDDTFTLEGTEYGYLAAGYLFASCEEMKVECGMEISGDNGEYVEVAFGKVSVEANKKTNIAGYLTD